MDFFQVLKEGQIRIYLFLSHLRMPQDYPQHIVEVVRYSACQKGHGFHFLGLMELCLEFFLRQGRFPLLSAVNNDGDNEFRCNLFGGDIDEEVLTTEN